MIAPFEVGQRVEVRIPCGPSRDPEWFPGVVVGYRSIPDLGITVEWDDGHERRRWSFYAVDVRPAISVVVAGGVYLTSRGYVSAEDLTPEDVRAVAHVFRLRDARWLSADAFASLCVELGLDVVRIAGVVVGRLRARNAA